MRYFTSCFIRLLMVLSLLLLYGTNAERILCIFPIVCKSHFAITQTIVAELVARGHQVTYLTAFPQKNRPKNWTDVDIFDEMRDFVDTVDVESNDVTGVWNLLHLKDKIETGHCRKILSSRFIEELVKSKMKQFDLLFVEMYSIHCFIPLSIELNVPIINTIGPSAEPGLDYLTGNPSNPSYIPHVYGGLSTDMTSWQRLRNSWYYVYSHYYQWMYYDGKGARIFYDIYGGGSSKNWKRYYQKLSLTFNYAHPLILSRPNVPNVIEIGGAHIGKEKPLPKNIKQFIDEAKDGVIFFSFGSTIKTNSLPVAKRRMFAEVFSKLPQRILWRSENLNLTEVSGNVKFGKWFPQRDILAHKNVRAFISHGGLLSTYETIHAAKPVIGIPHTFDQPMNIQLLEKLGMCIYLEYSELTVEKLLTAINEVLNNQSYAKNAEKMSAIFRDHPISPLDKAVYWIEYVMRHDGAPHLRSAAADMPLYQYLLLDVILFLGTVLICSIAIILQIMRKLLLPGVTRSALRKKVD